VKQQNPFLAAPSRDHWSPQSRLLELGLVVLRRALRDRRSSSDAVVQLTNSVDDDFVVKKMHQTLDMNRRQMLALSGLPAISQLAAQVPPHFRLRSGLVAYSYRTQLAAKSMSYEDLIRKIADWGLDGLDCTVYWLPEAPNTPNDYLARLRRTAYQCGVAIYNAGVRVHLCQPTRELQVAQFENIRKWVDVADRIGASHMRVFGGSIPKGATEQQAISWAVVKARRGICGNTRNCSRRGRRRRSDDHRGADSGDCEADWIALGRD